MAYLSQTDKQLQRYALQLTKYKIEAEDLYQETILKAYTKRDLFQEGTNFKAWILKIMYHAFINNYRKIRRQNIVEAPIEDLSFCLNTESFESSAEEKIHFKDINNLINELDYSYRQPLLMFSNGYLYKEISMKLNLPLGTVKSRINFARKKLKKQLNTLFENEFSYSR